MRLADIELQRRYGKRYVLGKPFMVGCPAGKRGTLSYPHVVTQCVCGQVSVTRVDNLLAGKSRKCLGCYTRGTQKYRCSDAPRKSSKPSRTILSDHKAAPGDVHGCLTVVGKPFYVATPNGHGHFRQSHVVVRCSCGAHSVIHVSCLYADRSSCSECRVYTSSASKTHGMSDTPVYHTWTGLKQRVLNRNGRSHRYTNIDIDPRWDESFEAFYEDMGDPPSDKHSIDRIDNTKGYWPWNCRWATRKEQQRNRRNTRYATINGETRCLSEWAEMYSVPYHKLYDQVVKQGIPIEKAVLV